MSRSGEPTLWINGGDGSGIAYITESRVSLSSLFIFHFSQTRALSLDFTLVCTCRERKLPDSAVDFPSTLVSGLLLHTAGSLFILGFPCGASGLVEESPLDGAIARGATLQP